MTGKSLINFIHANDITDFEKQQITNFEVMGGDLLVLETIHDILKGTRVYMLCVGKLGYDVEDILFMDSID